MKEKYEEAFFYFGKLINFANLICECYKSEEIRLNLLNFSDLWSTISEK
jgi:hypothetical protein